MIPRRNGFTIVELLIAMSLVSFLLIALGFGMKASMQTYDENDRLAQTTQAARVVLTRMTTEIRTANAVTATSNADGTTATITITPPTGNAGNVTQIRYTYRDGTLKYAQTANGTTTESVLMGADEDVHVTAVKVAEEIGEDADGNPAVVNVVVTLQLTNGNVDNAHTISVSPRRVQRY